MANLTQVLSGDSYLLEVCIWEDEDQTIPLDLSSITHAEYNLWHTDTFKTPLLTAKWKESQYITIPYPAEGKIIVNLRGDQNKVKGGQLYHSLFILDESGRRTTVLNEFVNLTATPYN